MASPLGHLAAGAAVWYGMRARLRPGEDAPRRRAWVIGAAVVVLSLLPDGDAALGILFGDFGRYHNNWTHSLLWLPIIGTISAFVLRAAAKVRWRDGFLLAVWCAGLHIAMDYATVGRGVMLLWPLSAARFQSPVILFHGLHWSQPWNSPSHLATLANELLWIGAMVSVIFLIRSRPKA